MDIVNNLLLWIHLVALAVGGAASFGIPVIGARMPGAPAEARPVLQSAIKGISTISRAALVVLLITGPLLVWLKFDGVSGFDVWFWIKMVLVAALLAGVIYSGILFSRAVKGDMAAAKRQPMVGMVSMIVLIGIILSAVLAFN